MKAMLVPHINTGCLMHAEGLGCSHFSQTHFQEEQCTSHKAKQHRSFLLIMMIMERHLRKESMLLFWSTGSDGKTMPSRSDDEARTAGSKRH